MKADNIVLPCCLDNYSKLFARQQIQLKPELLIIQLPIMKNFSYKVHQLNYLKVATFLNLWNSAYCAHPWRPCFRNLFIKLAHSLASKINKVFRLSKIVIRMILWNRYIFRNRL